MYKTECAICQGSGMHPKAESHEDACSQCGGAGEFQPDKFTLHGVDFTLVRQVMSRRGDCDIPLAMEDGTIHTIRGYPGEGLHDKAHAWLQAADKECQRRDVAGAVQDLREAGMWDGS